MGFSVGAVIEPKKGNEDEDMQFVTKYANDDGSVGAQRIQPNGKEGVDITIIDMDQLVKDHRHAQKRITLLEGYPENAAIGSEDFKTTMLKGAAALAVKRLSANNGYTKMDFRAQKDPKERLFALADADKGNLRVVPVTSKLSVQEPSAFGAWADVVVVGGVKFVMQRNVSTQSASEFFVMRISNEEKKGSMKIKVFQETVDGIVVKVPCAVNFKTLATGDEVVLYKPAPTQVTPKAKSVAAMLEPPSKKAKTGCV